MHIGGLHIFAGLLYFVACAVITIAYTVFLYLLCIFVRSLIYRTRYRVIQSKWFAGQGPSPDEILTPPKLPYFNWNIFQKLALLVLVFLITIYSYQRLSWLGNENTHYLAKEYWVAGQVVYAHRMLLGLVLHPDNPIVRPYTLLQKAIFARGERYLPEQDGERNVWRNAWFAYPYSRKRVRPYGVGDKEYEPEMVQLLDLCWESLEGMATKHIADSKMDRKSQLELPFLASYYSQFQGHYTGPYWLSGARTRTNKVYFSRNQQMLEWMDDLHRRWVANDLLEEIWANYPFVASFRQQAVKRLLNHLTLALPLLGVFSCDHSLMDRLYQEYQNAMSDDPTRNSFLNLKRKNPKQAMLTYQSAVYGPVSSAGNYLLEHVCGRTMPEEKYLLVEKVGAINEFYESNRVERVYKIELKQFIEGGRSE